jgi:hypothetical protein
MVNRKLTSRPPAAPICGSAATDEKHLKIPVHSHPPRRFLAIGFFDMHGPPAMSVRQP